MGMRKVLSRATCKREILFLLWDEWCILAEGLGQVHRLVRRTECIPIHLLVFFICAGNAT